ncbi:hypothetical protein H5410_029070 [Solanum commersonii]|uniref:S-protein homolog n=1 Tax=Solanum commersonii TaxID=4109 RepID=A0A9J5Z4I1_SOLCO|nr:hypothetical protein H5410_029070 [Solanum commersonii]
MTSNITNSPLILIFVMSLILYQFSFYSIADLHKPIVSLFDDIPKNLNPVMKFEIKLNSGPHLSSGELDIHGTQFSFEAKVINDIYVCYVEWNHSSAFIHLYNPLKEDKGHSIVYWSIQDKGIMKSWDKHKWTFVANWTPNSLNPVVIFNLKLKSGEPEISETLVQQGSNFTFYGDITHHSHICFLEWINSTALIEAYDPFKEDKGHSNIYWSVLDKGIRKSWDKPLILILIIFLTSSQFSFSFENNNGTPKVHLINNLSPNHHPTMQVTCKLQHWLPLFSVTLVHGQDFAFDAGIINDIYVCHAEWGNVWSFFNAYDPINEDKGCPIVYWSIRDFGLYKSWDKINWTYITYWKVNSSEQDFTMSKRNYN